MFFIEIALMLATFKVEKFKDQDGREVEPVIQVGANAAAAYVLTLFWPWIQVLTTVFAVVR
jgi:hypothetical protein